MSEIILGAPGAFVFEHTILVKAAIVFSVLLGLFKVYQHEIAKSRKPAKVNSKNEVTELLPIQSVGMDFKLEDTEPMKYIPFKKGPYKMTMAIKKCPQDEWLLVENTYKNYMKRKQNIMARVPGQTLLFQDICMKPLQEVYDKTMNFLVSRYPSEFRKTNIDEKFYNRPRDAFTPLTHHGLTPNQMLVNLALSAEEDILLLTKQPDQEEYVLTGGTWVFPGGFDPLSKLGKDLSSIHNPVPQYETKLKVSMNRFLARLKPHEYVTRTNWTVQIHTNLCSILNNHSYDEHEVLEAIDPETLNFNEVYVRSERQVLTKLPDTQAVIFTIRTYLFPMSQLREEGYGETLCEAIDSLPEAMASYKRRGEWGPAVKAYMRYDSNGKSK